MLTHLESLLDGARCLTCLAIALFFVRMGMRSRDRLYHAFSFAFVLLAANAVIVGLYTGAGDYQAFVFLPRLLAFVVIIVAIFDKNRPRRRGGSPPSARSTWQ